MKDLSLNYKNEKTKLWFEIKVIKNQTEDICLKAIEIDASILKFIEKENQTDRMCLKAININPTNLKYVKNQKKHICKRAIYNTDSIEQLHDVFQLIKNKNEEIMMYTREQSRNIYGRLTYSMQKQIQKQKDTVYYQNWIDSLINYRGSDKNYITTYINKYQTYKEYNNIIFTLMKNATEEYKLANLDRNKSDYSGTYLMFFKIIEKQLKICTGLDKDKLFDIIEKIKNIRDYPNDNISNFIKKLEQYNIRDIRNDACHVNIRENMLKTISKEDVENLIKFMFEENQLDFIVKNSLKEYLL